MRLYLPMHDGATATFDLFEPLGDHITSGKFIYINSNECIPYTVLVFLRTALTFSEIQRVCEVPA